LPTSVLDKKNRTVAALTKKGGHYMLVAGYGGYYPITYASQPAERVSNKKVQEKKIIKEEKKSAAAIVPNQVNRGSSVNLSSSSTSKKSFFQKVVNFVLGR